MKKRVLTLLLALLMVCALLPFGALAADLSPYDDLIMNSATTSDIGMLRDMDGNGTEELIMVLGDEDLVAQVYTISGGQAKQLLSLPLYQDDSGYSDLSVVPSGSRYQVATQIETYTPAGTYDGSSVYWTEGAITFYQLSGGSLQKVDVMNYRLLCQEGTNMYYVDRSTVTRNGKSISNSEMNAVAARFHDDCCDFYPMQQVYNAVQGFFQDVADDMYYTDPVDWAVYNDITKGVSNVDFAPDATCTRAQVVTFLWRAAGRPEPTSRSNPFRDVKSDAYYYNAVLWAVEKGITNGVSATAFGPDQSCTRGQVVTFLWRFRGAPKMSANNPFGDVRYGEYYYDAVLWAVSQNVTNGVSATAFGPNQTCTRAQIVTFLYRAIG